MHVHHEGRLSTASLSPAICSDGYCGSSSLCALDLGCYQGYVFAPGEDRDVAQLGSVSLLRCLRWAFWRVRPSQLLLSFRKSRKAITRRARGHSWWPSGGMWCQQRPRRLGSQVFAEYLQRGTAGAPDYKCIGMLPRLRPAQHCRHFHADHHDRFAYLCFIRYATIPGEETPSLFLAGGLFVPALTGALSSDPERSSDLVPGEAVGAGRGYGLI